MIVETKHGDFEVNEITRKQRRDHYKEVKKAFNEKNDLIEMHDLADKKLKGLTVVEEDEVLSAIIVAYMGLELGNSTGD